MKKVTLAVCGMGSRGVVYASQMLNYPEMGEVTAIADLKPERLEAANKYLHLPADRLFSTADEMFAQPKLADIMAITTQDAQHKEHALKALEKGYDLLLEKPISNKLEDIVTIAAAAKRLGRTVIVCHVLRYTPFYRKVKELLDQGVVGRVMSLEMAEHVGNFHYAHSYTRGNWHNEAKSSPMILAKSSHDMDLICWLSGEDCTKINSFGTQTYYNANNAPEGSADRCCDCKVDCVFRAHDFYLPRVPRWPTNIIHPEPTVENITEMLKTSDYGRCVYKMDNDVMDHQTVNMVMGDHITATFQMTGFAAGGDSRTIRVLGTEGDLRGDFRAKTLQYQRFGQKPVIISEEELGTEAKGHGGGDAGLILNLLRYYRGEEFDTSSITFIDRSVESHYMAFAAEASRKNGGELVRMEDFKRQIGAL